MGTANEDLQIRIAVDPSTGVMAISNFENAVVASLRRQTEEMKKASDEQARIAKKLEADKEAARQAGLSGFQRALESTNKALTGHAEALAKISPDTSRLITQTAALGQTMAAAASGGFVGLIASLDLARTGMSALVAAGTAVFNVADSWATMADSMADNAAIVGTTISQYSELDAAIRMVGEDSGLIRGAMTRMAMSIKEPAETTGILSGALGDMGISMFNAQGGIKTTSELLMDFSDGLAAMPDGFAKTQAAQEVLGRGGAALIPVLSAGSGEMRTQAAVARGLGATFTEMDAKASDAFLSAKGKLGVFSQAMQNEIGRRVTPLVTDLMEALSDLGLRAAMPFMSATDGIAISLARLSGSLDKTNFEGLRTEVSKAGAEIDSIRNQLKEAQDQFDKTAGATEEWKKKLDQSRVEAQGMTFAILDQLEAAKHNLEARKESIIASHDESAAAMQALSQTNSLLAQITQVTTEKGAETDAYREHITVLRKSAEEARAELEAKNLARAADERNRGLLQEIFKVKQQLASHDASASNATIQRKIRENEATLAGLRADESVYQNRRKLELDRLVQHQQVNNGIIAANRSVYEAGVQYEVAVATKAQQIDRGVLDAKKATVAAQVALEVDKRTVRQQLMQAESAADKAAFDAEVSLAATAATRRQQVDAGVFAARKQNISAEIALEIDRRTVNEKIANDRIALEARIQQAQTQRISDSKNFDLIAAAAVADKDKQIDGMRQQIYINDVTRTQNLHIARYQSLLELQAKELGNDALRQTLSDKEMVRRLAHTDIEGRILATVLEQEKSKHAVGAAQEVLNGLARRGFDVSALTAEACGQIAGGIGMASSASVSFTSNMQAAASAAQDIMRSGDAEAKAYARGLGGMQSGAAAGVGGGKTIKIGETTIAVPGTGGGPILMGEEARRASEQFQQAQTMALALEEAKRRNDEAAALAEKYKTPAQKAAEEQKKQLEAKRRELQSLPKNADFNRQMAELDLQIRNAQTAQSNQFAPGLAGLKNQADLLAQQSALLDTRRQVGNLPALSAGQNALDLLAQQRSIADSQRQLANLPAMSAGMTTLELLSQQSSIFNARRTLDSFDQMASGQNTLDLLSQQTNIKNAERALASFDAMSRGQNTLDLLSQQTSIKNTSRTLSAFDQMAAGQNVLDLMSQATSIKNAQRTLANFDAMAAGANVLDLLSQETSIANVARTLSNFSAMASGANTLDLLNQYGQNLTSQRQIANYSAMTPLLNNADILKAQTSALEIERGAVSDKRMVDWSLFGGSGRTVPQSNGLESLRTSTDPRMIALAQRMGIQRFATGTGLAGVQGSGSGDTQPALLTPGEVVLNPAESDVLRALAKGAGIDYERMAALFAKAVATELAGMSVKAEGREIGKLMLKQSRNGQRTTYAPAGLTKAR